MCPVVFIMSDITAPVQVWLNVPCVRNRLPVFGNGELTWYPCLAWHDTVTGHKVCSNAIQGLQIVASNIERE